MSGPPNGGARSIFPRCQFEFHVYWPRAFELLSADFSFMRVHYFLNGARYGWKRGSRSHIVGVSRNRVPWPKIPLPFLDLLPCLSNDQPLPRSCNVLESSDERFVASRNLFGSEIIIALRFTGAKTRERRRL